MKKQRSAVQLRIVAAVAALFVSLGSAASANQLWYDGFATPPYVAGNILNGQSGGTGTFFTGPWQDQSGNDHHVSSTDLPNGNQQMAVGTTIHPSVGGSVVGTDTPGTCCDTARDARLFTAPWDGFTNPDGTFYMGFLVNFGVGPTIHHRVLEMWDGDQGSDSNRHLQLGYSDFTGVGTAVGTTDRNMGIQVVDSGTNNTINQDITGAPTFQTSGGRTHFVVLRFDLSNDDAALGGVGDRIRMYLDPLGTTEPAAANADISKIDFLADRMGAITDFVFGDSAKAAAFDELRVGTTFADVANLQVPEPTSFVLLVLGAIGVLRFGRKK
jgi:hypothetical protein